MYMDTKDIAYFMAVYEEHSINKAAKKLFITSQGLSRVLKKLETEYTTEFFERTAQGVIPTESGRKFYDHCVELDRQMKLLREDMDSLGSEKESFKIGYANGVLQYVPLSKFIEFADAHKDYSITWNENANLAVIQGVRDGIYDYGFTVGKPDEEEFDSELMGQTQLIVLAPSDHRLAEKEEISLEDLQGEKIITMNENFRIYHDLLGACRLHSVEPEIVARTADLGTIIHLCMMGYGLAVIHNLPKFFPPQLKILHFDAAPTWDIYGMYSKEKKGSSLIQDFEKHMRD